MTVVVVGSDRALAPAEPETGVYAVRNRYSLNARCIQQLSAGFAERTN